MNNKSKWQEFRNIGLLWWINMILHTFGWAIFVEVDENDNVIDAYPKRTSFRGFAEKFNTEGYIRVSKYVKENAEAIYAEALEE